MRRQRKRVKSFALDPATLDYVASTQGEQSASERVGELLQRAIVEEQYARLEREAAEFFAAPSRKERQEARAFQSATRRTLARE